jgi:hypothetical protein
LADWIPPEGRFACEHDRKRQKLHGERKRRRHRWRLFEWRPCCKQSSDVGEEREIAGVSKGQRVPEGQRTGAHEKHERFLGPHARVRNQAGKAQRDGERDRAQTCEARSR